MAAIEFLLPLFASVVQGMLGHGLAENARAREMNEQRGMARSRREQLQPIINQLREAKDHFDLDEQFVRDYSRASNEITAQAASTGMANAGTGGLDHVRGDLLASGLAQLAQAKQQDEARRQQLLAEILSDPSLYLGEAADENVTGATLLGGLLGGVQGLGSNLASYLSSEAGMKNLSEWLGGGDDTVSFTMGESIGDTNPLLDMFERNAFGSSGAGAGAGGSSPFSVRYPDNLGLAASPMMAPQARSYYIPFSRMGASPTL